MADATPGLGGVTKLHPIAELLTSFHIPQIQVVNQSIVGLVFSTCWELLKPWPCQAAIHTEQ